MSVQPSLPPELWELVLAQLPAADLVRSAAVSRDWRAASVQIRCGVVSLPREWLTYPSICGEIGVCEWRVRPWFDSDGRLRGAAVVNGLLARHKNSWASVACSLARKERLAAERAALDARRAAAAAARFEKLRARLQKSGWEGDLEAVRDGAPLRRRCAELAKFFAPSVSSISFQKAEALVREVGRAAARRAGLARERRRIRELRVADRKQALEAALVAAGCAEFFETEEAVYEREAALEWVGSPRRSNHTAEEMAGEVASLLWIRKHIWRTFLAVRRRRFELRFHEVRYNDQLRRAAFRLAHADAKREAFSIARLHSRGPEVCNFHVATPPPEWMH